MIAQPKWRLAAAVIVLLVCIVALVAYGDVVVAAILDPAHAQKGDLIRLAAIVATGVFSIIAAWDAYRALNRPRPGSGGGA